ncbi:MAG TPA: dihydrodipicolinate synthase family protein [Bryobacteraceae bacterium]|jgi:4-hydroxy-tetrahydrodipicolinate synthase|nr:dihydrodipicolinate synthase family protein [Bryobacteraceae bacterium]
MPTRRDFLGSAAALLAQSSFGRAAFGAASKPMRGIFIIMATPYTAAKAVDYEDLLREVDFLDRSGVAGMVWPQMASEYSYLNKEERMRGMEVLARASRGKRPALVLGVQAANTEAALEYARRAADLAPDALIAMPPTEAKSLDDFKRYYAALAKVCSLPFFVQTTGGAKGVEPTVDFLAELAREFPQFGYVKEEYRPVVDRMLAEAARKPSIKAVFSGAAGRGMLYEMRMGLDGTMPGAPYADIYAQIWELFQSGQQEKARDLFARLMLVINLDDQVPYARNYILKKRGIFKTTVSRRGEARYTPAAMAEMDFEFAALAPYLRGYAG